MDFRILGTIEVSRAGRPIALGQPQERLVLGLLLLDANRVTPVSRIIDEVWGEQPPTSARASLQNRIATLRKRLDGLGAAVVTHPAGYTLEVDVRRVDAHVFTEAIARARRETEPRDRVRLIEDALALWRGPLMADLGAAADGYRPAFDELRLGAYEALAGTLLDLGGHDQVIDRLMPLAGVHPTRERLIAALMDALGRAGRLADALDLYRDTWRRLDQDLGIRPGQDLARLHTRLLADNDRAARRVAPHGPAQLPPDPVGFTGRVADLGWIDESVRGGRTAVVITAIAGMPGVGKTALALHWAHRETGRFPDGQLYVDLRGYDHRGPLPPNRALGLLLSALGLPADRIPGDEDAAAGLWRRLLVDRRTLVLLDNARSATQVRPLLPGGRHNVVLVTSRDKLTGLVAVDGAQARTLDVLAPDDAVALLARVLGEERAAADPAAVERLARLCDHLPLALCIAAAHLAFDPGRPVAEFCDDLSGDRLAGLRLDDDPHRAVRPIFDQSYRALSPAERDTFRLLGTAPGRDIGVHTAAALLDEPVARARAVLDRLAAAHLVTDAGDGRYRLHDLIRAYAAELAAQDPAGPRDRAASRVLDFFLQAVAAANAVLSPGLAGVTPEFACPPFEMPFASDTDSVIAFLDAEIATIVDVVRDAAEHRTDAAGWQLAYLMGGYLDLGRHVDTAIELIGWGVAAATANGDPIAQRRLLIARGALSNNARRPADALVHLRRAAELARLTGAPRAEAAATNNIGRSYLLLGDYPESAAAYAAALALYEAGDPDDSGIGSALNNLGECHRRMREFGPARSYARRALVFARRIGDRQTESFALTSLGALDLDEGRPDGAVAAYGEALALARADGNRYVECEILIGLARAHRESGDPGAAADLLDAGLSLAERSGNVDLRATMYVEQAAAHLARRDLDAAERSLDHARPLRQLVPDADEDRRIRDLYEAIVR